MSEYFGIDINALEKEWVEFEEQYRKALEVLPQRMADYKRAETEKELVEAELGKEIRLNPSSFGIEKVTENGISEATITHPRYKAACKDEIDKFEAQEVSKVEIKTLEGKKATLENLVDLWGKGYYNKLVAPPEASVQLKEAERDRGFRTKTHNRRNV